MKPPCKAPVPIKDKSQMVVGTVVHDTECEREWLIVGDATASIGPHTTRGIPDLEGVYPCLFFSQYSDDLNLEPGRGTVALLYDRNPPGSSPLHIAEDGLRWSAE